MDSIKVMEFTGFSQRGQWVFSVVNEILNCTGSLKVKRDIVPLYFERRQYATLEDLVKFAFNQVRFSPHKFVFLGHSMGALIAKRVARRLEDEGLRDKVIGIVSVSSAPERVQVFPWSTWILFSNHFLDLARLRKIELTKDQLREYFCNNLNDHATELTLENTTWDSPLLALQMFLIQFGIGPVTTTETKVVELGSEGDKVCKIQDPDAENFVPLHPKDVGEPPGHMAILMPGPARRIAEQVLQFEKSGREKSVSN